MLFKESILAIIGAVGAAVATALGGWDSSLVTLVTFMAADYVTGLIVAGVFKKSGKTEHGALESNAGWKGLAKKGVTLLIVLVSCRLDIIVGSDFIRDGVITAFIANETISIIENAGLMGIPIPNAIKRAIELLNKKSQEVNSGGENKQG